LLVAGLLEVVWAYTMKLSDGFTRLGPSVVTVLNEPTNPARVLAAVLIVCGLVLMKVSST
jgi:multidrug transporter EmrE-like cation transporter